jgi:hypothetical protein
MHCNKVAFIELNCLFCVFFYFQDNSDFAARVLNVKTLNKFIQSYEYDLENELWCEVIIGVSILNYV